MKLTIEHHDHNYGNNPKDYKIVYEYKNLYKDFVVMFDSMSTLKDQLEAEKLDSHLFKIKRIRKQIDMIDDAFNNLSEFKKLVDDLEDSENDL